MAHLLLLQIPGVNLLHSRSELLRLSVLAQSSTRNDFSVESRLVIRINRERSDGRLQCLLRPVRLQIKGCQ